MKNTLVAVFAALLAFAAQAAFTPPGKQALKALKAARGKQFSEGVVFIDGKYVPPPYVVERHGTVIRINGIQATPPLIAWEEFLKTQEGVKVSKTERPVANPGLAAPEPEPDVEPLADEDDPLADLFDDEPVAKKKPAAAKKPAYKPRPRKPAVTTTYSLEGEFVMNDAAKALLAKINQYRTDVDARLRKGGFLCFGSDYSRVSGDARTAAMILDKVPARMKSSPDAAAFASGLRADGFTFFPEQLCRDLYQNKVDYIKLQERKRAMDEDAKWNSVLNGKKPY